MANIQFQYSRKISTNYTFRCTFENGQRVYFNEENAKQKAIQCPKTKLTAFFDLCNKDNFAKTLLYNEIPKYYTWNESKKEFARRKQGKLDKRMICTHQKL